MPRVPFEGRRSGCTVSLTGPREMLIARLTTSNWSSPRKSNRLTAGERFGVSHARPICPQ